MLIHSVMMLDALLPPQEPPSCSLQPLGNGWVEGVEQNGQMTVRRIISTNPADYLKPEYMPGQLFVPSRRKK
ncbi:MAG: hypothetical protein J6A26_02430 [Oscillospiraceae bacterium]|nr:hypothetical protein [Oscillospiraceae bacterium]